MGSLRDLHGKEPGEKRFTLDDLKVILASMDYEQKRQFYASLEGKPYMTVQQFLDEISRGK
jgi:hypothetical protein